MTKPIIIDLYEQVSEITGQMLNAARGSDWDSLVALESRCATHMQTLKTSDVIEALTPDARARKFDLIKKILAHDQEIRSITQPRLVQLSNLMNSSKTERMVRQAYSGSRSD